MSLNNCELLAFEGEPMVLDPACGGRMFWFQKDNPQVVYQDNRTLDEELCDGRRFIVRPDVLGDFRDMDYPDGYFVHVVFDPPHLLKAGPDSWLAKKYGRLQEDWKKDLHAGFKECMRVLAPGGTLILKWNTTDISRAELLKAIGAKPLYGHKGKGQTIWMAFVKGIGGGEKNDL